MKDVERLCVFAFFEQLPAPQVGRIQFGRVDRVFDHTHAAQMAAEFYGPQRMLARERVKELTKECDFEALQMKKAEQAVLNGEKTE